MLEAIIAHQGIHVDKGVPVPPRNPTRRPGPQRYPFDKMEVGDSFFVPDANARKQQITISAYASRYGKLNGQYFTVRLVDHGVRCWRMK